VCMDRVGLWIAGSSLTLLAACSPTVGVAAKDTGLPARIATTPSASAPLRSDRRHEADWRNATVPGRTCFSKRPIHLHHGYALIPNRHGAPHPGQRRHYSLELATDWNHRMDSYGHLTGPSSADAVIGLGCSNDSGTADGFRLYSFVVFSATGRAPRAVAVLTPRVQRHGEPATLLGPPRISGHRLQTIEYFYGPGDSISRPSGRATTTWTYAHHRFRGHTTITTPAR
jgi:hypothetical protein